MPRYIALHRKYRDSTMIPWREYAENLAIANEALKRRPGAVVECGTWKGGMSAGLMEIGGDRPYLFFDSFEGLPPPQELDGQAAFDYQANPDAPGYYDNCGASLEDFKATIAKAGRREVQIYKGFFDATLPKVTPPPIAVLRLDGDWYDSTMVCLDHFWDAVVPDGVVIIDDYRAWDGCARAVHDFLSKRKAPERIDRGWLAGVAYLTKRAA